MSKAKYLTELPKEGKVEKRILFSSIALISGVLIMSFWVAYLAFADAPAGTPPYCPSGYAGCDAPLNVSINAQSKEGALVIANNSAVTTGLIVRYGKVGIGTTGPGAKLDIRENTASDSVISLIINNLNSSTAGGGIGFGIEGGSTPKGAIFYDGNGLGWSRGDIVFAQRDETDNSASVSTADAVMTIKNNGNVGIGMTPVYKLDVSGDARWSGTLQGGTVPWVRLSSFPSACSAGQYVSAVGTTLTCSTPAGGGGTVTSVGSGAGLTGGPITTSGTLSVDIAAISTCTGSGQKILWDSANNRFTCGTDQGISSESDTLQTVTNRGNTTSQDVSLKNLTLGYSVSEGNILNVNAVTGYNDLFLKSNSAENAAVYISGSQLSFYSGGAEKWRIDSAGSLAIGSVPWARLTSFPSACSAGQYVSAVGTTLTCSTPAAGGVACSDCDSRFVNQWETWSDNLLVTNSIASGGMIITSSYGIRSQGTTMGGYFKDTDQSGYAYVGYGDYGIYGSGSDSGGRFINSSTSKYSYLAYGSYGIYSNGDGYFGSGTITANKITANIIDPVFNIDGEKYATYMADYAGGLRVETSGIIHLDSRNQYVIDFDNLEKGSDLWLFWQTSSKNLDAVAVLLTPSFDGKTWYNKDGNILTIYGDEKGEISYRLSSPRVDYREWGNLAEDQSVKGINVADFKNY